MKRTPSLEQLCLDGQAILEWDMGDKNSEDRPFVPWPNLKVFVIGKNVVCRGPFPRFLPEGIRVIEILTEREDYTSRLNWIDSRLMQDASDWPKLEYFRCKRFLIPVDLMRMLSPSIASGMLKTLYISLGPYFSSSEQVQVVGLSGMALHAPDPSIHDLLAEGYMKWLDYYPNAHTISISPEPGTPVPPSVFKALIDRPGIKRIFQTVLRGVDWDEIQQLAKERGVVLHNTDFPAYFPWRLDDETTLGTPDGIEDVVEKWKYNRGWITEKVTSVVKQPFFQE